MVNGTLSKIIYIGAYALAALALIGFILLGMTDRPVGPELYGAFFGAMGIIGGAHLEPPINPKATADALADQAAEKATK